MTHQRVPGIMASSHVAARRIWKSPWPKPPNGSPIPKFDRDANMMPVKPRWP
jgi:hypothetical protein